MQSARLRPWLVVLTALAAGMLGWTAPAASQTHFEAPAERSGNNATVIIPAEAMDSTTALEPGDEIGVFSAEGHCAGAAEWTGENLAITIWGDDELTGETDGLKMDEPFVFHLWIASDEERIGPEDDQIDVELSADRPYYRTDLTYAPDAIYVVDKLRVNAPSATGVTMR